MGAQISRAFHRPPPPPSAELPVQTHSNPNLISNPSAAADLSSYEAACRADPDLQNFDSNLQLRTSRAINSIAVGIDVRSIPLHSLREVTECLLEMNQEVVKIILQNKRDVWKNKDLSDLVDDYFENSLLTLDFCTALDSCLKRAAHIESIVNVALRKFDDEHSAAAEERNYSRTLAELRNFSAAEEPFTQEFFRVFSCVYAKQVSMLERLRVRKQNLDKKLGKLEAWRKVSNVIFVVTFATVLICSVVAAAVSAPPVVSALAAAAAVPLGSMGRWLNALWKKCERDLRGQREIISSMEIGTYIVLQDLANIRALVNRFQVRMEELLANAGFATAEEEEAAVVVAVEEIRKKVEEFMQMVRSLSDYANKCTQETRMARTLILRRIINHPSSSSNQEIGMFS
ncbi:transmembrane protein [Perilla frutescens var. frutescens]|nr:transmembrane protein [Perilla frutescens var. frutescens]